MEENLKVLSTTQNVNGTKSQRPKMSIAQDVNDPKCQQSKMWTTQNVNGPKCQRPKMSMTQNVNDQSYALWRGWELGRYARGMDVIDPGQTRVRRWPNIVWHKIRQMCGLSYRACGAQTSKDLAVISILKINFPLGHPVLILCITHVNKAFTRSQWMQTANLFRWN